MTSPSQGEGDIAPKDLSDDRRSAFGKAESADTEGWWKGRVTTLNKNST